MRAIASVAIAVACFAGPAAAQLPANVLACATVARDADRLACFDAAVAGASPQARAASEARAAETARIAAADAAAAAVAAKTASDAAQAAAVAETAARQKAFGGETVAAGGPERFAPPPGELQEISANLTEILVNQSGLGVFLLDNGQLWRQVDTSRRPRIKVGDAVTVSKAPLGGYRLNFVKQKAWVLVKRVR